MKVCVVHPKISSKSAGRLAERIGADCVNPFQENRNYGGYDLVFNYGCSKLPIKYAGAIINSPKAIYRCIDKRVTHMLLKNAGIPTVDFCLNRMNIPKHWKIIICRATAFGAKNEGMTYVYQGDEVPKAELYTEYFNHRAEYRIVVFQGKVIARYRKVKKKGEWELVLYLKKGFEEVDTHCINAAKVLGIDYVGFDVLEARNGKCVLLEANSAPILTDEVLNILARRLK